MRSPMLPILMMLAAPALGAQRLQPPMAQLQLRFTPQAPPLMTAHDHAWEGAKIGGLVLGLGTIGLAYIWCDQGDGGHATTFGYCAPRALLGGVAGATIGAIIGGVHRKRLPQDPSRLDLPALKTNGARDRSRAPSVSDRLSACPP